MIVLEVYGNDYAAVTFEDDLEGDVKKYVDLCNENGGDYQDEEAGIEFQIHEFDEVDPDFIEWVKNTLLDYDDSKHHNFYVLEGSN